MSQDEALWADEPDPDMTNSKERNKLIDNKTSDFLKILGQKQKDLLRNLKLMERRNNAIKKALTVVKDLRLAEPENMVPELNKANDTMKEIIREMENNKQNRKRKIGGNLTHKSVEESCFTKVVYLFDNLCKILSEIITALRNLRIDESLLRAMEKMKSKMKSYPIEFKEAYHELYRHLYNCIIEQTKLCNKMKVESSTEVDTNETKKRLKSLKNKLLICTGKEWNHIRGERMTILTKNTIHANIWREEGPSIFSSTPVNENGGVFPKIKEFVKQYRAKEALRTDARILFITGTHGAEYGVSGLTNKYLLEDKFYHRDSRSIGVQSGPEIDLDLLPMKTWESKYPNIRSPSKRVDPPYPFQLYADEEFKQMDIRVANMAYYHKQEQTFIDDIIEFKPDVLILAFCYSMNGDMAMLLRRTGIMSEMLITHDLRTLTQNPTAKLNPTQWTLLNDIVESDLRTPLFLWGSAGTGKTLMLNEALKIKLSKFLNKGKKVRVLATTFSNKENTKLLKKYEEKYLVNMSGIEVMSLSDLCSELKIIFDDKSPCATVTRVIDALSSFSDMNTLLLIDEVLPCHIGQPEPDWKSLRVRDNVTWLLGLSPEAKSAKSNEICPPQDSSVLSRHLLHKHRNCPEIRKFYEYYIENYEKERYLSMDADQELEEDELPPGHAPVWLEPPSQKISHVQILKRVDDIVAGNYQDVMVLFSKRDDRAADWCEVRGWKYLQDYTVTGCEAQCVVLLSCGVYAEYITRGINMLIMVVRECIDCFQAKDQHGDPLVQKIPWIRTSVQTNEEGEDMVGQENYDSGRFSDLADDEDYQIDTDSVNTPEIEAEKAGRDESYADSGSFDQVIREDDQIDAEIAR